MPQKQTPPPEISRFPFFRNPPPGKSQSPGWLSPPLNLSLMVHLSTYHIFSWRTSVHFWIGRVSYFRPSLTFFRSSFIVFLRSRFFLPLFRLFRIFIFFFRSVDLFESPESHPKSPPSFHLVPGGATSRSLLGITFLD